MKIIENIKDNKIDFEKISFGEVFKHNNNFFMRIENAKVYRADVNKRVNAIELSSGICCEFPKYCKVEKVNATMSVIG